MTEVLPFIEALKRYFWRLTFSVPVESDGCEKGLKVGLDNAGSGVKPHVDDVGLGNDVVDD